jgi:predicted small lipoprotein YifL
MPNLGLRHALVSLGASLALLTGCEQKGPMEKAGQKIDKAVEDTGKEIKKAGEKAADKVRDATK